MAIAILYQTYLRGCRDASIAEELLLPLPLELFRLKTLARVGSDGHCTGLYQLLEFLAIDGDGAYSELDVLLSARHKLELENQRHVLVQTIVVELERDFDELGFGDGGDNWRFSQATMILVISEPDLSYVSESKNR